MPGIDVTQQALVVEVVPENAVAEFTEELVTVSVANGTPLVEFPGFDGGGGGGGDDTTSTVVSSDGSVDITVTVVGTNTEYDLAAAAQIDFATREETDAGVITDKALNPDVGAYAYDRLRWPGQHEAGKGTAVVELLPNTGVVTVDCELSNVFEVSFEEDLHFNNPVNPIGGQTTLFYLRQNAIGGWGATFGTDWTFVNKIDPVLTPTANAVDVLSCAWDTTTAKMRCTLLPNYGAGEVEMGSDDTDLVFSNVGDGNEVFKEHVGLDVRFRTITGSGDITVTQTEDTIDIGYTQTADTTLNFADLNDVDLTGVVSGDLLRYVDGEVVPYTLSAVDTSAQTYVTFEDETADLPNSRRLTAGTGLEFSYDTEGVIRLDIDTAAALDGTQSGAQVRRTTNQTIGSATDTAVIFDTEDRDDEGYFSSLNPSRMTIPVTGWYVITAKVRWDSGSNGNGRNLWLRKNGTTDLASFSDYVITQTSARLNAAGIEYLTAGDYIEVIVRSGEVASRDLVSSTVIDQPTFSILRAAGVGAQGEMGPAGPTAEGWASVQEADQSVLDSTTFVNATGLQIAVTAGETYFFQIFIWTDCHATPDLKGQVHFSGDASNVRYERTTILGTSAFPSLLEAFDSVGTQTTTGAHFTRIHGTFVCTADGVLSYQFAQNTASASFPVTVKQGSNMFVRPANVIGGPRGETGPTGPTGPAGPLANPSLADEIIADNPSGYWKMDDVASILQDSSGNNYDSTSGNITEAAFITGLVPSTPAALYPRIGSSDTAYWQLPITPFGSRPINRDWTIEAMMMPIDFTTSPCRMLTVLGTGETEVLNYQLYFGVAITGELTMFWEHSVGTNDVMGSGFFLTEGQRYHLVCVKDTADMSLHFYIDGVYVSTVAYPFEPTGGTDVTVMARIGYDGTGSTGSFVMGHLAYYDGVQLSASRIFQHYVAATQGLVGPPGPAAATGRHSVWVSAGAMLPSATGGCQALAQLTSNAGQPDIVTLNFDPTTQEYAQFSLRMPKSWNEGAVTFVPVWSHPATSTNFGVVWDLQAVAIRNDDSIAAAFGTAQTSTDTGGTTNDVYMGPESTNITVGGTVGAESLVFFRISRVTGNASDTMAVDARLHGITLYMTTDADNDA